MPRIGSPFIKFKESRDRNFSLINMYSDDSIAKRIIVLINFEFISLFV